MNEMPSEAGAMKAWIAGRLTFIAELSVLAGLAATYVTMRMTGLASMWIECSLQIGMAIAGANLAASIVHHVYPSESRQAGDNEMISGSFATIGAVYALVLGFVIVVVWQQYSDTEATVAREANAIADVERMSRTLPLDAQRQVQGATRAYLRLVIQEEWGLMARGQSSSRAQAALFELWTVYTDVEAKMQASPLYERSVTRLNELGDNRRQRLNDAGQSVSSLMWVMLYAGGVVTVLISYLFDVQSQRLHRLLIMMLSGVLMFALFLTSALQSPFDDNLRISPEMFQAVLDNMRQLEI